MLANEQVIDGKDERTGQPVVQKMMAQWFFRITKYADELLETAGIDWPDPVKHMQANWIGRSEGARVTFTTDDGDPLEIYTTRPDTLWGATFMVLAPEHPLVASVTSDARREAVEAYVAEASRATELERADEQREKTGVFTGGMAVNPVSGERIPIWIADYVMMGYGSGAIMAVPAHDQRDFAFARRFDLPVHPVILPEGRNLDGATMEEAYVGPGVMANSDHFDGTPCSDAKGRANPSIDAVIEWLEHRALGRGAVNYRLRDWLISRQRYWGTPIPMLRRADDAYEPVSDADLPVQLPEDVEFLPSGQSPLVLDEAFRRATDANGQPAERETDTMDTFMCSSWYQYRYLSPRFDEAPFDPDEAAYWLPVDVYTGGAEHATMHLLYTRFFTKAMRDLGVFDATAEKMRAHGRDPAHAFDEPMLLLRNQGQILGEERRGDVIRASGREEGEKLVAERLEVIDPATAADVAADFEGVVGEIRSRTETVLRVEDVRGGPRLVEVPPEAEVEIPAIPGENDVNQLKHHLEVQRMSKSKGNVVSPDELVERYGADTVRAYLMFAFDWEKGGPWDSQGVMGVVRWISEVWDVVVAGPPEGAGDPKRNRELERKVHQANQRVSESIEKFSFNTAVAALMTLRNDLRAALREGGLGADTWSEAVRTLLLLMAPIAPHVTEELWSRLGLPFSIHQQAWPAVDPDLLVGDTITLAVQVNGKRRDEIEVPADADEDAIRQSALASERVQKHLDGREPRKVIVVPGRLVNVVG